MRKYRVADSRTDGQQAPSINAECQILSVLVRPKYESQHMHLHQSKILTYILSSLTKIKIWANHNKELWNANDTERE